MKDLKNILDKDYLKKLKNSSKESTKRVILEWQDYAAGICKEFEITKKNFKSQIFALAKNRRAYLEGKVSIMRELDPQKYNQLKNKNKLGNYLFSLFRKNSAKKWGN